MAKNRRATRLSFVNPQAQIRYFGLLNLVWIAISVFILYAAGIYLRESIAGVAVIANIDEENTAKLSALANRATWIAMVCAIGSGALSFYHSLAFSHRLYGPLVPLTRLIRELKEGIYTNRIRLREKDELGDVIRELNELAETLEKKSQAPV